MNEKQHQLLQLLLGRLERISADSHLAHRASGLRGSLIRISEQEISADESISQEIRNLFRDGFKILEESARERIRNGPGSINKR